MKLIWKDGHLKMMKININQLQNYYKIYCAKTPNLKNRMFKTADEFYYIITRKYMEHSLRGFGRKTCNVSKIHQQATQLLAFGDKNDFADIDSENIISKCSTLEASLRIMKNKHMEEILHE